MYETITKKLSKVRLEEHLEKWPATEMLMIYPQYVKGTVPISVKTSPHQLWLYKKEIWISDKNIWKTKYNMLGNKPIANIQSAINDYVKEVAVSILEEDNKFFFKCRNDMGPFFNKKGTLVLSNGTKKMQKGAITVIGKKIYEARDEVFLTEKSKEGLFEIGKVLK